jgi:hypothetical protein
MGNDFEGAVGLGGHLDDTRSMTVEVAENPLTVLESATVATRVAVDAEDGCGRVSSMLLDNESEGLSGAREPKRMASSTRLGEYRR